MAETSDNEIGNVIGIDPGNTHTAVCRVDRESLIPQYSKKVPNSELWDVVREVVDGGSIVGIECIASYGMAVGKTVFETAEWSGRIREMIGVVESTAPIYRVYRRDVKLHICESPRAKDSNIRAALIDRYPATGGGKIPQVGTKASPGPLFGFSKDQWAALGVAITLARTREHLEIWD